MGGLAACHLASKCQIDLCIADRTFSCLDDIIINFKFGELLHFLYKTLLFKESDNVKNYLNANCEKVILYDPADLIVSDNGSLKTGVAKQCIKSYSKDKSKVIKSVLDIIFDEKQRENFKNTILTIAREIEIYNKKDSGKAINPTDSKKNLLIIDKESKIKVVNSAMYTNLEESTAGREIEDRARIETLQIMRNNLLKSINDIFENFESAGVSLSMINSTRRKNEFIDVLTLT
jgi:hypothetical protein